jgi:hypothetical protein
MPYLMQVRDLDEELVPGYRTLNVLGLTPGPRGLLYHRLFSSQAPMRLSEPAEVQEALQTVSQALGHLREHKTVTWLLDSGFDDVAVWRTIFFLFDLGVTFEWAEVQLLAKLGGGNRIKTATRAKSPSWSDWVVSSRCWPPRRCSPAMRPSIRDFHLRSRLWYTAGDPQRSYEWMSAEIHLTNRNPYMYTYKKRSKTSKESH